MSSFKDVSNVEQRARLRQVKADWDSWKGKWNQGPIWGIVGGGQDKLLPKTVLNQVLMHGEPDHARDGARSIEGLGNLITSLTEILDGDVLLKKHQKDLEKDFDHMKKLLKTKKWNPRNIPFKTVVSFKETEDPKKPEIIRGVMRGHYRTLAYNQYVEWALEHKKNFKGTMATAEAQWSNKDEGQARPPLWAAISEESEDGIMTIVADAIDALKKVKIGPNTTIDVTARGAFRQLAQIESVKERVYDAINKPDIYPKGAQRAPLKDRLNAEFRGHSYAIRNPEEAQHLNFARGFKDLVGIENIKQIILNFPKSNLAINRVIYEVLGEEINTFQKPGTTSETHKPGLTLKSKKILNWQGMIRKG